MQYNWGIIGLGKIAHKFAEGLQVVPDANLYSVASRTQEKAREFAEKHQADKAYGSYEEMLEDTDLDAVYISTPHHLHYENTLQCLNKGKAVLCEKPFAMNAAQSREMIECARKNNTFLMEAFWTRFHPHIEGMLELIADGRIGKALSVKADFGFAAPFLPKERIFNRALGGGALLDIGVYPVFLSHLLFGNPDEVYASTNLGSTGVDETTMAILKFPGGKLAVLDCSIAYESKTEAWIYGENGNIHIESRWHNPGFLILIDKKGKAEKIIYPLKGNGYNYQVNEVHKCLADGKIESEKMSHHFSLELMEIMDRIRSEAGIVYPEAD